MWVHAFFAIRTSEESLQRLCRGCCCFGTCWVLMWPVLWSRCRPFWPEAGKKSQLQLQLRLQLQLWPTCTLICKGNKFKIYCTIMYSVIYLWRSENNLSISHNFAHLLFTYPWRIYCVRSSPGLIKFRAATILIICPFGFMFSTGRAKQIICAFLWIKQLKQVPEK